MYDNGILIELQQIKKQLSELTSVLEVLVKVIAEKEEKK